MTIGVTLVGTARIMLINLLKILLPIAIVLAIIYFIYRKLK